MPGKMFTQDQLSEMMRKRIERSHNSFFKRYGVNDLNELDELFDKSNTVDELQKKLDELNQSKTDLENQHNESIAQLKDLAKKYAFMSKGINPDKYSDIETYFKGKNLDINEATLDEELKSHSDWVKSVNTVVDLGSEQSVSTNTSEKEQASKFFGVNL